MCCCRVLQHRFSILLSPYPSISFSLLILIYKDIYLTTHSIPIPSLSAVARENIKPRDTEIEPRDRDRVPGVISFLRSAAEQKIE